MSPGHARRSLCLPLCRSSARSRFASNVRHSSRGRKPWEWGGWRFFKANSCTSIAQLLVGCTNATKEMHSPGLLQHSMRTQQKTASARHKAQPQKDTGGRRTEPPPATSPSNLLPFEQINSNSIRAQRYLSDLYGWQHLRFGSDTTEIIFRYKQLKNILNRTMRHNVLKERVRTAIVSNVLVFKCTPKSQYPKQVYQLPVA